MKAFPSVPYPPRRLRTERHILVRTWRPVGHMHGPCIEVDEDGADRHGALLAGLPRIGMAADGVGRAEMVGGGRAHVLEGKCAAMHLQQRAHAIGAIER